MYPLAPEIISVSGKWGITANEVILLFTALRRDNILEKELATKTLNVVIKEYDF